MLLLLILSINIVFSDCQFFMPDFDGLTQNVMASMAVNQAPNQAPTLPFRNAVRGRRIGDLISEAISEAYLSATEPVYNRLNNYNQMYLPTRNIAEMPYENPNLMWLMSATEPVYNRLNNYNQMYLPTRNIAEMPYENPNLMWLRNRMMFEAQLAQNGFQGVPYQMNPYIFH